MKMIRLKKTMLIGLFFFVHGVAQAMEASVPVTAAVEKANLILNVRDSQGNNIRGRCSKLLQNCTVVMETANTSSTIAVINNSSTTAKNIQAHFPVFAPSVSQDGGCLAPLAPGASCTITLTINDNISGFTLLNVPIYGTNTSTVYFNLQAIQLG